MFSATQGGETTFSRNADIFILNFLHFPALNHILKKSYYVHYLSPRISIMNRCVGLWKCVWLNQMLHLVQSYTALSIFRNLSYWASRQYYVFFIFELFSAPQCSGISGWHGLQVRIPTRCNFYPQVLLDCLLSECLPFNKKNHYMLSCASVLFFK